MDSAKIKVRISNCFNSENVFRQLPAASPDDLIEFQRSTAGHENVDFWIVHESTAAEESVNCPHENTILITAEPPMQRTYPAKYLRQFHTVVHVSSRIAHDNTLISHQALPWHVGLNKSVNADTDATTYDHAHFSSIPYGSKQKRISVICSSDVRLPGHQKRFRFVQKLRNRYDGHIDFYGRGIHPIDDKLAGIAPYDYHICIENSSIENYWSEKIGDSFLGWSVPIYYGCTNISDFFEAESIVAIDIDDFEKSCKIIDHCLTTPPSASMIESLARNRERILNEHNFFSVCERVVTSIVRSRSDSPTGKVTTIRPLGHFATKGHFLADRLKRIPSRIKFELQSKLGL